MNSLALTSSSRFPWSLHRRLRLDPVVRDPNARIGMSCRPLWRGGERRGDGARPRLRTRTGEELVCGSFSEGFSLPRPFFGQRRREAKEPRARAEADDDDDEAASAGVGAEPAPTAVPSDHSRIGPEGPSPRPSPDDAPSSGGRVCGYGRSVARAEPTGVGAGRRLLGSRAPTDALLSFFCRSVSAAAHTDLPPFSIPSGFSPKKATNC